MAKQQPQNKKAKSAVEFQNEDERDNLLLIANTHPSDLLKSDKPILFDEWQDAPKIWGTIRKSIDDEQLVGAYILTGSSSNKVKTAHTGTLRISRVKIYPMSLFESGDSNGTVSLKDLFNNSNSFESCHSDLQFDDIKYVICRGGWPQTLNIEDKKINFLLLKHYQSKLVKYMLIMFQIGKETRKQQKKILKSYSRNICTFASLKTLYEDCGISENTFKDYLEDLEKLNIVNDVNAWCLAVRSKDAIRSGPKRNLVDPSIATSALQIDPDYLSKDYQLLGFLFESLCIRDLRIYSSKYGGDVSYYHDRYGLEEDAGIHLENSKFALVESKLGQNSVDEGSKHLNE